ncbi:MAG: type II toxin-antitoxin system PemK/MazF family toxin [Caldilineales bacterium]
MSHPQRGEVYWVNLDPVLGSEIAKTRPALIISNNVGNQFAERVIVAPISSSGTERVYPFEVLLPAGEAGLSKISKVLLDQIRTVDKQRLGSRVGLVAGPRMEEVNRAIRLSLAV